MVREVVATMDSLDDMAKTASSILQSNVAARVSALAEDAEVAALRRPSPSVRSNRRAPDSGASSHDGGRDGGRESGRDGSDLCRTHVRYGRDAFKCDRPLSCSMRSVIRPRSGNGPAGRR